MLLPEDIPLFGWNKTHSSRCLRVVRCFSSVKKELGNAITIIIEPGVPAVVETDASDTVIATTFSQWQVSGFFLSEAISSRELPFGSWRESSRLYWGVEMWRLFLIDNHSRLATDQWSEAFTHGSQWRSKTKNEIQRWRVKLHFKKKSSIAKDMTLSLMCYLVVSVLLLSADSIRTNFMPPYHSGVTSLFNFVRARDRLFSVQELKDMISRCRICAKGKANFQSNQAFRQT